MIRDFDTLTRIRSLAIPPAWTEVWICPDANGHVQATGRDARGRKQPRYHPRWRETRDQTKFERMIDFARALPRIRRITGRHLRLRGLPREKVLAAVVQLLEKTLIRVGNEEYKRTNGHYGLTTLKDQHVRVRGAEARFRFRGKSGVQRCVDLHHPRLARVIRQCQDLPGQELFQYVDDDGTVRDVGSADVNAYLREISGRDFTAKEFRTWAGTVLAAQAMRGLKGIESAAQAKRNIVRAVESVAQRLGNTKAVCRKCYIHPAVLDAYLDRQMVDTVSATADRALRRGQLRADEAAVLALLQERLRRAQRKRAA
jgi:DNA topoisomerase-1